jgi:hypothetical protein
VSYGVRLNVSRGSQVVATSKVVTGATVQWTHVLIPEIEVPTDADYTVALEAYHMPADGIAWFDDITLERTVDLPVDVFLRYPNFRGMLFDDQAMTIRAGVTVAPPATGGPFTLRARLADGAGAVIAETRTPAVSGELKLDVGRMERWRVHTFTVSLLDAAGVEMYSGPAYRVARVPGSQKAFMNIAVDDKNRVLLRGKPRFLLGVYDSGLDVSTGPSFWQSRLWSVTDNAGRRMEGVKINAYLNYHFGATRAAIMKVMMDNLQKRGVVYFQTANCFAGNYPTASTSPPAFVTDLNDQDVKDNAAHPGFAGYYVADECRPEMVSGTFARRQRLMKLNPGGATLAVNLTHLSSWRDAVDLLGVDSYPMIGKQPAEGYKHEKVATATRALNEAVQLARPPIMVLQFFSFLGSPWPTLQQMRTHAYMAIIEGARGLFWWSLGERALAWSANNGKGPSNLWDAERTEYMNRLTAVVNELADLEPALVAEPDPSLVRNVSDPAIHWLAKRVSGRRYLFTCNYADKPVTVVIMLSDGHTRTETYGPYEAKLITVDA